MSKFKIGDAVRVKAGSINEGDWACDAINESKGKRLVITKITEKYACFDNDGWGWYLERFEPWNDSEEWDGEKWVAKKPADRWFKVKDIGKVYKATLVSPNGDCVLDFEGIPGFFCKNDVEEVHNYNQDDCKPKPVPGFKTEPHLDITYWSETLPVTVTISGVNYIREEQPQPKPAIVILREDGILKPSTNPTVHESTSKAKAEAKRLAEKCRGKEFVVFQEVDRKRVEKPIPSPVLCGSTVTVMANGHEQKFYVAGTTFDETGLRSASIMPAGEPCKS